MKTLSPFVLSSIFLLSSMAHVVETPSVEAGHRNSSQNAAAGSHRAKFRNDGHPGNAAKLGGAAKLGAARKSENAGRPGNPGKFGIAEKTQFKKAKAQTKKAPSKVAPGKRQARTTGKLNEKSANASITLGIEKSKDGKFQMAENYGLSEITKVTVEHDFTGQAKSIGMKVSAKPGYQLTDTQLVTSNKTGESTIRVIVERKNSVEEAQSMDVRFKLSRQSESPGKLSIPIEYQLSSTESLGVIGTFVVNSEAKSSSREK